MPCGATLNWVSKSVSSVTSPNRSRLKNSWKRWMWRWNSPKRKLARIQVLSLRNPVEPPRAHLFQPGSTDGFHFPKAKFSMINGSDILKAKILVVDDQQANVLLLDRVLRGAGYDSIAVTRNPR